MANIFAEYWKERIAPKEFTFGIEFVEKKLAHDTFGIIENPKGLIDKLTDELETMAEEASRPLEYLEVIKEFSRKHVYCKYGEVTDCFNFKNIKELLKLNTILFEQECAICTLMKSHVTDYINTILGYDYLYNPISCVVDSIETAGVDIFNVLHNIRVLAKYYNNTILGLDSTAWNGLLNKIDCADEYFKSDTDMFMDRENVARQNNPISRNRIVEFTHYYINDEDQHCINGENREIVFRNTDDTVGNISRMLWWYNFTENAAMKLFDCLYDMKPNTYVVIGKYAIAATDKTHYYDIGSLNVNDQFIKCLSKMTEVTNLSWCKK